MKAIFLVGWTLIVLVMFNLVVPALIVLVILALSIVTYVVCMYFLYFQDMKKKQQLFENSYFWKRYMNEKIYGKNIYDLNGTSDEIAEYERAFPQTNNAIK